MIGVTFGRWQPLAAAVAPDGPGLLQARFGQGPDGLADLPRGRSAMALFDADERSLAAALARLRARAPSEIAPRLYVRFAEVADPAPRLRRLLDDFTARFGAPPPWNAQS